MVSSSSISDRIIASPALRNRSSAASRRYHVGLHTAHLFCRLARPGRIHAQPRLHPGQIGGHAAVQNHDHKIVRLTARQSVASALSRSTGGESSCRRPRGESSIRPSSPPQYCLPVWHIKTCALQLARMCQSLRVSALGLRAHGKAVECSPADSPVCVRGKIRCNIDDAIFQRRCTGTSFPSTSTVYALVIGPNRCRIQSHAGAPERVTSCACAGMFTLCRCSGRLSV